nr:hypothetical protein [Tanacetum cinerariifolium]
MAPPGFAPVQNGHNRFNQNPGQGNNFNRGNNFQPFQVPNQGFQNPPFQVLNNLIQQGFPNEFLNYKKVNDQMMRNMENQIDSLKGEFKNEIQNTMKTQQTVLMEQQNAFQNNLQNMLSGFFQNQSSTSGTLPSNTIPNPKGEMKAITTRSGYAYEGPSIPTPKKVAEQVTEETTDKEQSNFQGSNTHIQPPVIPMSEPDVSKTLPKPNLPYPSRLNDQKLREKATNKMEKFFQIFQDLHFDISFADALLLMPKFASTIKSLLTNKDKLFELAKIPLNENCSAMLLKKLLEKLRDPLSLPKLTPTRMTLELADRSITRPKGFAEDVFIKVGKFHFPTDFVVVDFEAGPHVPLILGRSFFRTSCALVDVYGEEITLWVNDEAVTLNSIRLRDTPLRGSPTSTLEPILSNSSHSLTLFEGSDFILEEIEAYLKDDSVSPEIDHAYFDPEEDICLIEKLLNDDPLQLPPMDLKEVIKAKSSTKEPSEVDLKDLPSHLEYAYLEENDKLPKITDIKGIDPRSCTHKILMEEDFKPSVQSQRRVNPKIHEVIKKEVPKLLDAGMIYPISDSPWIARPMTHLLEKETPFVFSKDCINDFETLKKKLTEAQILVVPDWNLPFELMCDASDFAIGAVLGQRKTKHFQPIHYASKTMTEAQMHYTTTEKEMLAVVYAFEKFWPYLVLFKSIVYTDHSALKYLLNKQDAKPRLIRRVLLL